MLTSQDYNPSSVVYVPEPIQVRLWLSKLGVDTSIGWAYSAPLVEIGLRWLPKLGVDTSPRPHAHRRA